MEVTTVLYRLLMIEFILLGTQVQDSSTQKSDALLLRIDPNRQQHFEYHTVSFHCEGGDGSSQLRRVRSSEEINPECQNKRTSTGFVCTISNIYIADSGEYWCKTKGGQISNSVNITVTAGSVILDSPALPVSEGDALTLSCKDKTTTPHLSAVFYRDDVKKESSSTGELIINSANKSHEGLYKCIIPGAGESPESLLAVRALHREMCPCSDPSFYVVLILRTVFTIVLVALLLLLVGLLHCGKLTVTHK
ncbi:high affinity immunoglobulin gamma Fc receptor I-like [Sparus aurata]|uniref:high affinity immunoglobulin gamma Fc receptor I-like n=1 Tax=Sparus aurata TaxID=8175 RepID=UPI0011C1321E|nr:high affinity immunoglobulin gamma Fc receptor I-like [Sparus aurata]